MISKKEKFNSPFTWPDFQWKNLNYNDFVLYFHEGIFKIKLKENPEYLWAKVFLGPDFPEEISLLTETSEKRIKVPLSSIQNFDFSLPSSGAYNFKNSVYFFFRKFSRQWKKGICKESSLFENILYYYKCGAKVSYTLSENLASWTHPDFLRSPKNLACLFNCSYSSLEESYESLRKKKIIARAITKDITLSLGANNNDPILWFSSIPVGSILSRQLEISLFYPEIEEEIHQLFPSSSIVKAKGPV